MLTTATRRRVVQAPPLTVETERQPGAGVPSRIGHVRYPGTGHPWNETHETQPTRPMDETSLQPLAFARAWSVRPPTSTCANAITMPGPTEPADHVASLDNDGWSIYGACGCRLSGSEGSCQV